MSISVQNIPKELIYEMVDGQPIYYKGYQDYLSGKKQLDEIMGSSYIQSLIITKLVILLGTNLAKKYRVLTNEIGLQFSKNSWRAADIVIMEKERLKQLKNKHKYLELAPKVVLEIDTKASIEEVSDALGYYHKKTDELIAFGVEKVLWIFTDSQKVLIAEKDKHWEIIGWEEDFIILDDIYVNVESLVREE